MAKDVRLFSDYFGVDISDVTMDFKERNHVDLLINQSFVRNGSRAASEGFLVPDLLCKYRYRDSRVPMGVWAYAINRKSDRITGVPDCLFDEYPWPTPIDIGPEVQEDVDLFSDLL
jgi:hypothetical protein